MGNSFTTTPATSAAADYSVTVTQAIAIVERALMVTDYSDDRIKDAIEQAVNHALRETHCNAQIATLTTESGTSEYDVSDIDDALRSPKILGVFCGNAVVQPVDYTKYLEMVDGSTGSGKPTHFTSLTPSQIILYPTPDDEYTVKAKFWTPCVSLASGSTVINVPRDFLIPILRHGAAALCTTNDPDTKKDTAWARFIQFDLPSIKRACYTTRNYFKKAQD